MKLTIIGCAGSFPNQHSSASCYLLEQDGFTLLMDLGNGALGSLHNFIDPLTVDAIIFSHMHADHCLDIAPMYVLRRYHPQGIAPRIPVYGPVDVAHRMSQAYGMASEQGMSDCFDIRVYPAEEFELGPFHIQAFPVVHPVPAHALRINAGGGTLVFSGDTAPCPGLADAAQGAEFALFEASFRSQDDNPEGVHLTAAQAAEFAERAGAQRLLLTHLASWHDNSGALAEASAFSGQIAMAETGQVWQI